MAVAGQAPHAVACLVRLIRSAQAAAAAAAAAVALEEWQLISGDLDGPRGADLAGDPVMWRWGGGGSFQRLLRGWRQSYIPVYACSGHVCCSLSFCVVAHFVCFIFGFSSGGAGGAHQH